MRHFADTLSQLVAQRGAVCAGIDPRPAQLPLGWSAAAWGSATAELLGGRVAMLKPQLAFFDDDPLAVDAIGRAGARGGALLLADAKRGDIGSTAEAYARRWLAPDAPIDALTINPYLGPDSLTPFVDAAAAAGKGVFVLVRTSNPGAAELQSARLADGTQVVDRVAEWVRALGEPHVGASGWSLVGAVVGLTVPADEVARLRALMPHTPFLMPGYGAQGGSLAAYRAACGSAPGGALVSASRSLTLPWRGPAPADWRAQIEAALEAMNLDLREG
ncbi:MAG: orotidine-5'-phosphate decarboxylase [Planctomycetes bacterium]|nr:orotidine-5'-phosphate decarboxylase [Planctomycetota bacterium]